MRVRDELEREVVDARRAQRPVGELRELALIAAGQVEPRRADLLLDQVIVVDEPLGRRRDLATAPDRIADEPIRVAQRQLVVAQARQQPVVARGSGRDLVPAGDAPRVALELRDVEELGPDRRGFEALQRWVIPARFRTSASGLRGDLR